MSDQIKTVSDMMKALEEEIAAVKSGAMTEGVARMVFKGRALQLNTAQLQLQHARLQRSGKLPDPEMRLIGGTDAA